MQKDKSNIRTLLLMVLTLALSVSHTSCMSDIEQPLEKRACLVLFTNVLGQTRAAADPYTERLHKLRIIILRPDGTVEYNRYIGNSAQINNTHLQEFWVIPDEKKTILFVGNEYDSFGLDAYAEASSGVVAHLDTISYTFDPAKPIPMTGTYEIPAIAPGDRVNKTFYVIRSATKFTFEFKNERTSAVTVSSIAVSRLASTSYLMPHFTRQGIWRDIENDGTFSSHDFMLDATTYTSWERWMEALVNKQQTSTEDRTQKTYSDYDGWIVEYNIPNVNEQTEKTLLSTPFDVPPTTGELYQLDQNFYFPESKDLKGDAAAIPNYEQSYTLSMVMGDKDKKSYLFTAELPNLRALFRNTHVKVTVNLGIYNGKDVEVNTAIVPWQEGEGDITIDITPGMEEPGLTES